MTKIELLRALGHFAFASKVIPVGRAFVSYLIKLSTSVKKLHHHVTLTKDCILDLKMWAEFLSEWNGISIFLEPGFTSTHDLELYTDASGTISYGGYYRGRWFQGRWPTFLLVDHDASVSMEFLELYPIVVSALIWGQKWSGKRILFHCDDNQATVFIITKGRSNSCPINGLVRILTMAAARGNFFITANFLPSRAN